MDCEGALVSANMLFFFCVCVQSAVDRQVRSSVVLSLRIHGVHYCNCFMSLVFVALCCNFFCGHESRIFLPTLYYFLLHVNKMYTPDMQLLRSVLIASPMPLEHRFLGEKITGAFFTNR